MPESERTTQRATALFALLLLVGATVMIVDGARQPAGGPGLGPGAAPVAIGALLSLVGAGLLVQARAALRFGARDDRDPGSSGQPGDGMLQNSAQSGSAPNFADSGPVPNFADSGPAPNFAGSASAPKNAGAGAGGSWWRVAALVAALLGFAVLLPIVGYVVSSAGLFAAAALLLGAPRSWNVLAYGWAVAAIAFLVFDRLIGLSLPVGPWGF